jgi:CRP-like cAMP-binding protein
VFAQRSVHYDAVAPFPAVDPHVTCTTDTRALRSPTEEIPDMFRSIPTDNELTHVPLFADLSRRQLNFVAQLSTSLDLPAGAVLARQGSIGAEFFVVLQGQVEVVRSGDLVATRGPGSPLGEIALLGALPRTATLVTQTPVHARVASQREFAGLLAEVPEISQRLHAIMAERLAA